MTYRQYLISMVAGWALMLLVAVLTIGTDGVLVVVIFGGGLVVLSLALAFVIEHGGQIVKKLRENGDMED